MELEAGAKGGVMGRIHMRVLACLLPHVEFPLKCSMLTSSRFSILQAVSGDEFKHPKFVFHQFFKLSFVVEKADPALG